MKIDVSEILKQPGASISFHERGSVAATGDEEYPLEIDDPVDVRGVATSIGQGVYIEANVKGRVKLVCFRCLNPFRKPFDLNCEARFVEEGFSIPRDQEDEDDIETFTLEGSSCNLDDMIKHEIILNLPMKPLCRPDCRGLCPVCGKNLNEGDCDCEKFPEGHTLFGKKLLEALEERSKENGRS